MRVSNPRLVMVALGSCLALAACNSDENSSQLPDQVEMPPADVSGSPPDPIEQVASTTVPMTVSLGQALRCSRIGEFAARRDRDLGDVTSAQARIIALKAKNSAYAEGAKQNLTPSEIEEQERAIYLGYEGAGIGAISVFGNRTKEEEDAAFAEADRKTREAIARVEPELTIELNELCAPLFLD